MKTLIVAAIRCALMFTAVAAVSLVHPAQAYTVTLEQVGSNVVATGSGAINLTELTFVNHFGPANNQLWASGGVILTGAAPAFIDGYGGFTGPTSFGSGGNFFPSTSSGDFVGIAGPGSGGFIFVPLGYVSGAALSDSMTFTNATFASLGVTPGRYVWRWGPGADQNFTLQIGSVPDGGSTVSLLGFALFGLAALRRKLRW